MFQERQKNDAFCISGRKCRLSRHLIGFYFSRIIFTYKRMRMQWFSLVFRFESPNQDLMHGLFPEWAPFSFFCIGSFVLYRFSFTSSDTVWFLAHWFKFFSLFYFPSFSGVQWHRPSLAIWMFEDANLLSVFHCIHWKEVVLCVPRDMAEKMMN